MGDDFSKYAAMRDAGSLPEEVYREALRDGVEPITRIRLLRAVYVLSPRDAKEVVVRAHGSASSLDEFQGNIADSLQASSGQPKD